jgi:type I restriction enzyme S subunit
MTARFHPIGDLCELRSGGTPSRSNLAFFGGSIPWAKIADLDRPDGRVLDTDETLTPEGLAAIGNRLFPPGTVLLAMYGSVGKVAVAGRQMSCNQAILGLQPRDASVLDAAYLRRWLESRQREFAAEARGVTQKNLSAERIATLRLALPPLPEQRRTAALLDKADAIRSKRQKAIRLADDLLSSVFLDMFGDPVTNSKAYPICRLDEIATIVSGVTKGRKLDPACVVSVPYMRVANVQDGHLLLDDIREIEALPEEVARYRLETGDVLLTEGGDPDKLGRGAVWRGGIDPCIHQNHIFRVRSSASELLPDFLSAQLGSARGKRYFARAAKQTTGIASINMTQLSAFPVLLPPLEAQAAYGKVIDRFRGLERHLSERYTGCDRLYESLAQAAFQGDSQAPS